MELLGDLTEWPAELQHSRKSEVRTRFTRQQVGTRCGNRRTRANALILFHYVPLLREVKGQQRKEFLSCQCLQKTWHWLLSSYRPDNHWKLNLGFWRRTDHWSCTSQRKHKKPVIRKEEARKQGGKEWAKRWQIEETNSRRVTSTCLLIKYSSYVC